MLECSFASAGWTFAAGPSPRDGFPPPGYVLFLGSPFYPRGSIYTTIMESGRKRPSRVWCSGHDSAMVVNMDPLGTAPALRWPGREVDMSQHPKTTFTKPGDHGTKNPK